MTRTLPALLISLVVLFLFAWRLETQTTTEYFSSVLTAALGREEVYVDGVTYEVERGSVVRLPERTPLEGPAALPMLKLAYAKTLLRTAPLMTLAGNDPDEVQLLLGRLEKLQADIAALQKDAEGSRLVEGALYPLSFLHAIARSEETRQRFLADGSEQSLSIHLTARTEAIRSYQKDLAAYRRAFEKLIPETSARYLMGDRLVTDKDVRALLSQLSHAIEPTVARNRAERACLQGATIACEPLRLEPLPATRVPPDTVDPAIPQLIERFSKISPNLSYAGRNPDISNVLLSHSACIDKKEMPLLYTVRSATSTDGSYFEYRKVRYIGELRYILSDRFPEVPFYRYFAERGVHYLPTSPLLHYICPEFGQDVSRVRAVDAAYAFADRYHLSRAEGARTLAPLEQRVIIGDTAAHVIRESATREYLAEAYLLLRKGAFDTAASHALQELILATENLSVGWSDAVELVLEADEANVRLLKKGLPVDLEAAYTFFFRTPVLLLYMADNPSVGSGATLGGEPIAKGTEPYVYYSKLKLSEADIKKVADDTALYTLIHQQPLEALLEPLFVR